MLGKQVYEVTLIMRDTIKCGKDLLSLGLLIPEIELNQLTVEGFHCNRAQEGQSDTGPDSYRKKLTSLILYNP